MGSPALIAVGGRNAIKATMVPDDNVSSKDIATIAKQPPQGDEEAVVTSPHFLQIPKTLWEKNEQDITNFLSDELYLARSERQDFMKKIARWKTAYKAPLSEESKNWPIFNASNITIPVIKEMVNTLATQLVQITLTHRPRWVIEDLAHEWEPFIDDIERFLDIASDKDLHFDEACIPWIIEAAKLGTSIIEIGHEVDERRVYRYSSDGKTVYPRNVKVQDGPRFYHIPLHSFWIRFHEKDIQKARWVGKRLRYKGWELKQKAKQGKFFNVDKVLAYYYEEGDIVKKAEEAAEKTEALLRKEYEVFEIWLSWDIDADGNYEELRLYYHEDSKTFLSRQFHPYWHGQRPFVKIGYFPVEDRFYDEGLAEMLEAIQEAVSTKHNQRSDNATMANLKMIIKRKMLKTLMPGDPLYTGKIIEANDIWNDVREFQLAEIYPSTVNEEMLLRQYADRLAGANEGTMGAAMPVTRTTAFAQAALLQEQLRRIDLPVRNIRRGLTAAGNQILALYFQFGVNGKGLAWMGEKGRIVEAVFRLPARVVELGMALKASSPTSAQNKATKRENSIALFNLMVQLYERLLPLAAQLAPEAAPEVARGLVRSAKKFMLDTLEAFDTSNPDEVLEGLAILERVLPSAEDLGGLESYERAVASNQTIAQLSRLEDLLREAEASGRGSEGLSDRGGEGGRVAPQEGRAGGNSAGGFFGGDALFGG